MIDYWNLLKKWLTQGGHYSILIKSVVSSAYNEGQAAVAQLVERRLGKAEVGGSNPLGSLFGTLDIQGFFFLLVYKLIIRGEKNGKNFNCGR